MGSTQGAMSTSGMLPAMGLGGTQSIPNPANAYGGACGPGGAGGTNGTLSAFLNTGGSKVAGGMGTNNFSLFGSFFKKTNGGPYGGTAGAPGGLGTQGLASGALGGGAMFSSFESRKGEESANKFDQRRGSKNEEPELGARSRNGGTRPPSASKGSGYFGQPTRSVSTHVLRPATNEEKEPQIN